MRFLTYIQLTIIKHSPIYKLIYLIIVSCIYYYIVIMRSNFRNPIFGQHRIYSYNTKLRLCNIIQSKGSVIL